VTVRELKEVLSGWDENLQIVDKEEKTVRGARIVETKDGPKVKLG
jgi:hypothetical protein